MGKVYTFAEVAKHNNSNDCWLIIGGKVYDVTRFVEEHPGGDQALLSATGKDATVDFEDVNHSGSAIALMEDFCIGEIETSNTTTNADHNPSKQATKSQNSSSFDFIIKLLQIVVPLIIFSVAFGSRFYTKASA